MPPKIIPYAGYFWRVTEILSRDDPFMVVVEGRPEKEERPSPIGAPPVGAFVRVDHVLLKLSLPLDTNADAGPIYQAVLTPSFDNLRSRATLFQNYDDNRFGPAFAEVLQRIRNIV